MDKEFSKKKKNPVKFDIQLNEEQKEAKRLALAHDITVITGVAGAGKTLTATNIGLDLLLNTYGKDSYEKVIILRPVVFPEEDIGFLPGSLEDKLTPIMRPILANFESLMSTSSKRANLKKLIEDNIIEILPIQYSKGITYRNTCVIVDEAEDMTVSQMLLILTRLGKGSKIIITGDLNQQDLKGKSGLDILLKASNILDRIAQISLISNHRKSIVKDIIATFKKLTS